MSVYEQLNGLDFHEAQITLLTLLLLKLPQSTVNARGYSAASYYTKTMNCQNLNAIHVIPFMKVNLPLTILTQFPHHYVFRNAFTQKLYYTSEQTSHRCTLSIANNPWNTIL